MFYVAEKGLAPFTDPNQLLPGDLVGIPPQRLADIQSLIVNA
jgi:hypothetical protein